MNSHLVKVEKAELCHICVLVANTAPSMASPDTLHKTTQES